MFFWILKTYARLAIKIYCRKIIINKPEYLQLQGPVLFAANHPNSFLDGIILTTLLKENLYSLARGDAFKNKKFEKLLRWMHLLPVYRTSEGVENLEHNYTTFTACHDVFRDKGLVMIFSEGRCINEWHLRPLRKGTARLAISTWEKGIDLTVIPIGFNYNSFRNFGKNVFINFGKPLHKDLIIQQPSDGKRLLTFNEQLKAELENLVFEIAPSDKQVLHSKLFIPQPFWKKVLLSVPAAIGFILHAPLYFSIKAITNKYFDNDHFDSVVVALCMLTYLIYLPLLLILVGLLFNQWFVIAGLFLIPFSAWSCVQLKRQLDN